MSTYTDFNRNHGMELDAIEFSENVAFHGQIITEKAARPGATHGKLQEKR